MGSWKWGLFLGRGFLWFLFIFLGLFEVLPDLFKGSGCLIDKKSPDKNQARRKVRQKRKKCARDKRKSEGDPASKIDTKILKRA